MKVLLPLFLLLLWISHVDAQIAVPAQVVGAAKPAGGDSIVEFRRPIPGNLETEPIHAHFSPDEKWIIWSSAADSTVRIVDIATGDTVKSYHYQHGVGDARISPDGTTFAVAFVQRTPPSDTGCPIYIQKIETGEVVRTFRNPPGEIWALAFSHDGTKLYTASEQVTRIWDVTTGEMIRFVVLGSRGWYIDSSQDDSELLVGTWDGTFLFRTSDGKKLWQLPYGAYAEYTPGDEAITITHGGDSTVYVVDPGGTITSRIKLDKWANMAVMSPDKRFMVTTDFDNGIETISWVSFRNPTTGAVIYRIRLPYVYDVEINRDATKLLLTSSFGNIWLYTFTNSSTSGVVSVEQPSTLSVHPNPSRGLTRIEYTWPRREHVSASLVDAMGSTVAMIREGVVDQGTHILTFDVSGLSAGAYRCWIRAASGSRSIPIVVE